MIAAAGAAGHIASPKPSRRSHALGRSGRQQQHRGPPRHARAGRTRNRLRLHRAAGRARDLAADRSRSRGSCSACSGLVEQMAPQQAPAHAGGAGRPGASAGDPQAQFIGVVLKDTENTWNTVFQKSGKRYVEPTLVLFDGRVASACGMASAAVGPFYCPLDSKVYLDLAFFRELARRFGAPGRLRPGLRGRARGRPPRPEPARASPTRCRRRSSARAPRRRRTRSRCGSSCRPTASPASTATSTSRCSTPATSRRGCAPRPRSATT